MRSSTSGLSSTTWLMLQVPATIAALAGQDRTGADHRGEHVEEAARHRRAFRQPGKRGRLAA